MIKKCKRCKKKFSTSHRRSKYCSRKCVAEDSKTKKTLLCHLCKKKHTQIPHYLKRAKLHFCSNNCKLKFQKMENHPRWNGGRFIDSRGYRVIKNNQYPKGIYEHRYVMELKIGRKLKRNEHVHHMNGIKTDNRLENLKLMTNAEHAKLHGKLDAWSIKFKKCIECGTVKVRHYSLGLCKNCYTRKYNYERRVTTQIQRTTH